MRKPYARGPFAVHPDRQGRLHIHSYADGPPGVRIGTVESSVGIAKRSEMQATATLWQLAPELHDAVAQAIDCVRRGERPSTAQLIQWTSLIEQIEHAGDRVAALMM